MQIKFPSAVISAKPVQNNCIAGTPFRIKISVKINIYIEYMPFGLYILAYLKLPHKFQQRSLCLRSYLRAPDILTSMIDEEVP